MCTKEGRGMAEGTISLDFGDMVAFQEGFSRVAYTSYCIEMNDVQERGI